jgi:putative flavoprotein involved in K+ transport
VPGEPGLYFVGLHFLYALSSAMIHGVGRDAAHVARVVAQRVGARREAAAPRPVLRSEQRQPA